MLIGITPTGCQVPTVGFVAFVGHLLKQRARHSLVSWMHVHLVWQGCSWWLLLVECFAPVLLHLSRKAPWEIPPSNEVSREGFRVGGEPGWPKCVSMLLVVGLWGVFGWGWLLLPWRPEEKGRPIGAHDATGGDDICS